METVGPEQNRWSVIHHNLFCFYLCNLTKKKEVATCKIVFKTFLIRTRSSLVLDGRPILHIYEINVNKIWNMPTDTTIT